MITRRTQTKALIAMGLFTSACDRDVKGHEKLVGRWGGVLGTDDKARRVVLEIAAGQPIVLKSIDRKDANFPATAGKCSQDQLDLQFASVKGKLKLKLDQNGALTGVWRQGQRDRALTLVRLQDGQEPQLPEQKPFGDFQAENDAAHRSAKVPALAAAFVTRRGTSVRSVEVVSGVTVTGGIDKVRQGLSWHVGSITKSMTATLFARLVERGLLSWDATIWDAFGEMAPDMNRGYRHATLAHLLSGSAGMPTNIKIPDLFGHDTTEQSPIERRKIWVKQALALPPVHAVGEGFVYPNNGYVLAGALCERVANKPYEDLMIEEVFKPLGMQSAGFGPPPLGNPQGHRRAFLRNRLMPVGVDNGADNPPAMSPAGRARMTLKDLVTFGLVHSDGHRGLRNEYLKQETWQFLHTPPIQKEFTDYAFGWVKRTDGTLWHNGSNTYWLAELAFDPTTPRSACACANVADSDEQVGHMLSVGLAKAAA